MPTKLEQLQLQFRQKLMQEKEEKMIKIHTDNQMKALSKVTKYNGASLAPPQHNVPRKPPPIISAKPPTQQSPVKKGSPGVDRSRPLPPINRDSKSHSKSTNHIHRSPQSSSSSDKSSHDGGRSRSVDLESADSILGAKMNGSRAAKLAQDLYCVSSGTVRPSSYQQFQQNGKRSPDYHSQRHTEQQRWKVINGKQTQDHQSLRISNGDVSTSNTAKSSVHNRSQPSSYTTKTPSKATAPFVARKPSGAPKPRNGFSQMGPPSNKPPNPGQESCRHCGRNFNQDRIAKHVSICSKTASKKVKVFDATKMRVQGTEAENFVKKGPLSRQTPHQENNKTKKRNNWKKQHEDFINAIRQAKMAQRHLAAGGKLSDLPPPKPSDTSDYVPCRYCGRKFNEGVAQRHIPKCKNILSNKKPAPKKK